MTEPLYDAEAERSVLGAALLGRTNALLTLATSDFYEPAHSVIAATIREMVSRGMPVDAITTRAELESRNRLSAIRHLGGSVYLHKLTEDVVPASAGWHADIIRTATIIREAHIAATQLAQSTTSAASAEYMQEILHTHRERLDELPGPLGNDDDNDDHDTLGALLTDAEKPIDWLIPGHLARGDRVVIVAAEGVAKTTICRQMAVSYAGGLNPWTGQRVADGLKVLYVDAENSRAQSSRAYKWIAAKAYRPTIADGWKSRLIHKTRNDGVDLVGRDEKWFRDLADRICPDVIILGPAYKIQRGDPHSERDVQNLLDVIDKVRVQHDAAVLIEAHAPHGGAAGRVIRPFGASVWLRWPEIVLGYQRDSNIPAEMQPQNPECLESIDARGRREERDWPHRIRWGAKGSREMPWVPSDEFWKPSVNTNYVIPDSETRAA